MDIFSLKGKIALITGGSYGIGFAMACALAEAGAQIVFNDLGRENVDKGLAAYAEAGIDAKGYVCDVTDEAAVANREGGCRGVLLEAESQPWLWSRSRP